MVRKSSEQSKSRENFESIELTVRPAELGRNTRIEFRSDQPETCAAYNSAIEEIAKREILHPFHQLGVTPKGPHAPGEHIWEMWGRTDADQLALLVEEIHVLAEQKFQLHQELGLHEMFREKYS